MLVEVIINKCDMAVAFFGSHVFQKIFDLTGGVDGLFRKSAPDFVTHAYIQEGNLDFFRFNVTGRRLLTKVDDEKFR